MYIHRRYSYYNITFLQKFNNYARHACMITRTLECVLECVRCLCITPPLRCSVNMLPVWFFICFCFVTNNATNTMEINMKMAAIAGRVMAIMLVSLAVAPNNAHGHTLSLEVNTVHMFFDFDGIDAEGRSNVSVSLGQVVKHVDQPIVVAEHPWEDMLHFYTSMVTVPASLSPTGVTTFMLFYSCMSTDDSRPVEEQAMFVCVANSTDGVAWEKPMLPFYPWQQDKTNAATVTNNTNGSGPSDRVNTNRVFRTNDTASWPGSVFIDDGPTATAASRFKLTYEGNGSERMVFVATSPDGFTWSRRSPEVPIMQVPLFSDTQTAMLWDAPRARHVVFGRRDADIAPNTTVRLPQHTCMPVHHTR